MKTPKTHPAANVTPKTCQHLLYLVVFTEPIIRNLLKLQYFPSQNERAFLLK